MCEVNNFKIDLDGIRDTFKFSETGLTNKQGVKYKLLPYAANEKTLVSEFSGVVGAFSRIISNKDLKDEFEVENFINDVADRISDYQDDLSKEYFKDIVRTMFIDNDNLVDFDIKTINYISSTSSDEKIANFLYSTLFDENIKSNISKYYDRKIDNIMYKIVLDSLPELREKEIPIGEYKCYLPFVREQFIKDFKFLISQEELYKDSLKRLLEYYYMFYVSQLVMKLESFEDADTTKPDKLYYTLDWEKTGKTRTAYQFGWEKIKNSTTSLFSHAVVLEMLNHNEINDQLGYKELAEIFNNMDEKEIESQLNELINEYIRHAKHVKNWNGFEYEDRESNANGFNLVNKLFNVIRYQFENSSRGRASEAYKNWFVWFVQKNFGKRRGRLGYNLNMTEDDIILMTKLCINNQKKLKLNELFEEFELRGLFFDRDSQTKIVQLYEKLNLLEKKSDSGDAQYVKSIL